MDERRTIDDALGFEPEWATCDHCGEQSEWMGPGMICDMCGIGTVMRDAKPESADAPK